MIKQRSFQLIAASITVFLVASACKSKSLSSGNATPVSSPIQNSDQNSVSFKIQELGRQKVNKGEEVTWLATHESSAGMARFQIRLILRTPRGDSPFAISTGSFISEPDSQYSEFLRKVAKALEAKNILARKSKTSRLDFTVAVIGQNLSRGSGADVLAGSFTSEPRGDWVATKVFVADGDGEFYLNLNSKEAKGEISIKDADYGDIVLRELSRVFY
jgi:hypothetical protein